jgi:membrane-bound lytic murein transglycosylase D
MKKMSLSAAFLGGVLVAIVLLTQYSFRNTLEPVQWKAPAVPEQLSFAGEKAPLERWDVKEKFEKEYLQIYYAQGNILYLVKLAHRNFPIISERLKANGVPDDFKYLCIAESNMQSWAVSKSGAVGYWQFLDGTAPGYGLEVSSQVDQRQDLEKATDAACRYFKDAYRRFGNWTAAAASYNCGMGGYAGHSGFQKTTHYYDLQLPEETNKYIYRILSFKHILENAESLGFVVKEEERYQPIPTRRVTINAPVANLAQFAIENGTTYKMLRNLNPWIKGRSLHAGSSRSYTILLPDK